jgi:hypothetical protein
MNEYTCPCCGYIVFSEAPGSYDVCHVCFWEDDDVQLADPWFPGGANKPNLIESQKHYKKYGAMGKEFVKNVKGPQKKDMKDASWREVIDSDRDFTTTPREIYQHGTPKDIKKAFYYWIKNKPNKPGILTPGAAPLP